MRKINEQLPDLSKRPLPKPQTLVSEISAKEMFESCGYMLEESSDKYTIRYVFNMESYGMKIVEFDLTEQVYFAKSVTPTGWVTTAYIYTELHQAINQQMKELRWFK